MSKIAKVKFEIEIPLDVADDVTDEQVIEWIEFELRARGELPRANPLTFHDIEARGKVEVECITE